MTVYDVYVHRQDESAGGEALPAPVLTGFF
jgi:hypothetical protein